MRRLQVDKSRRSSCGKRRAASAGTRAHTCTGHAPACLRGLPGARSLSSRWCCSWWRRRERCRLHTVAHTCSAVGLNSHTAVEPYALSRPLWGRTADSRGSLGGVQVNDAVGMSREESLNLCEKHSCERAAAARTPACLCAGLPPHRHVHVPTKVICLLDAPWSGEDITSTLRRRLPGDKIAIVPNVSPPVA